MKAVTMKIVPVLSALALATVVVPYAHAGCGEYRPASFNVSSQHQFGSALLLAGSVQR